MNPDAIALIKNHVLSTIHQGFVRGRTAVSKILRVEAVEGECDLEVKEHLIEKSISTHLLKLSILTVALKALHYFIQREWISPLGSFFNLILNAPTWLWSTLTWAFIPLVCGVGIVVVTWLTVILDRCIPGVYPPSTVSSKKYRSFAPLTCHIGWAIALFNGFILSLLVYLKLNSP